MSELVPGMQLTLQQLGRPTKHKSTQKLQTCQCLLLNEPRGKSSEVWHRHLQMKQKTSKVWRFGRSCYRRLAKPMLLQYKMYTSFCITYKMLEKFLSGLEFYAQREVSVAGNVRRRFLTCDPEIWQTWFYPYLPDGFFSGLCLSSEPR